MKKALLNLILFFGMTTAFFGTLYAYVAAHALLVKWSWNLIARLKGYPEIDLDTGFVIVTIAWGLNSPVSYWPLSQVVKKRLKRARYGS